MPGGSIGKLSLSDAKDRNNEYKQRGESQAAHNSQTEISAIRQPGANLPGTGQSFYVVGGGGAAGGAVAAGAAAAEDSFTRSFNSLLGLKKGIFFAGTSTRSPVFGLRPTRGRRWRVRKLPKPRISILSPARSERTTLSKIVSTITSLSLRVSSAKRETSSIRSAFVISRYAPARRSLNECRATHNLLKFQGLYASHDLDGKNLTVPAQPAYFHK